MSRSKPAFNTVPADLAKVFGLTAETDAPTVAILTANEAAMLRTEGDDSTLFASASSN